MARAIKYVVSQMLENDHAKYYPIAVFDNKYDALKYIEKYGNHDKLDRKVPRS